MSTKVIQVTNIAPGATKEQMSTLFGFLGKIDEVKLYPVEDSLFPVTSRVCYVKYSDPVSVGIAQHLTNTVFIDRALIVVSLTDGIIPDEDKAMAIAAPASAVAGLLPQTASPPAMPANVINQVQGMGQSQVITTVDPRLTALGLPQYPPLPGNMDPSKIEEIRRTVYVGNLDSSQVTAEQLLNFFNQVGEVKYVRMAGDETQPARFAFVEFSEQNSVAAALQYNGVVFGGRPLKVNHSNNAIVKPQAKSNEAAQREIEEAMKRVREAQSLITAAIEPETSLVQVTKTQPGTIQILNHSPQLSVTSPQEKLTEKEKKRSRSRSRSKSHHRSRSRSRKRSRSRHSSRSRRRSRSHSRRRSRSSRRSRSHSRRRSRSVPRRSHSRGRHSRSRSRDRKVKKRSKSRSRTPKSSSKSAKSKEEKPKPVKEKDRDKGKDKKEVKSSDNEIKEQVEPEPFIVKKEPKVEEDVKPEVTQHVEPEEMLLEKIKSPLPKSPSPKRKKSRSPSISRRKSKTPPPRKKSRSRSRSRHRKSSRSPSRRKSRSRSRRKSHTPVKRRKSRSRSRRKSRSPSRRKSRSHSRRKSRSPSRRKSARSPARRKSRTPVRRRSRTPRKRYSRSSSRRRSRSRNRSRTPKRRSSRSRSRSRSPRHSSSNLLKRRGQRKSFRK